MIKTAPSDILRPPFGASAIQPHACREVQPTSRPVDNSPLKFPEGSAAPAGGHHSGWVSVCGPAVRGYACIERGAVPRSTKRGDPKCQEELTQRFPSLDAGCKIIRHAARSSRWQVECKNTWRLTPRHRQRVRAGPRTSDSLVNRDSAL
jgi:hypothetical protein